MFYCHKDMVFQRLSIAVACVKSVKISRNRLEFVQLFLNDFQLLNVSRDLLTYIFRYFEFIPFENIFLNLMILNEESYIYKSITQIFTTLVNKL